MSGSRQGLGIRKQQLRQDTNGESVSGNRLEGKSRRFLKLPPVDGVESCMRHLTWSNMNPTLRDHPDDDYPTALPAGGCLTALPAAEPLTALPASECPAVLPATEVASTVARRASEGSTSPLAGASGYGARHLPGRLWRLAGSVWEWVFGAVTLIVGLAVLAALPVVGLLTLGYLLEAGGRIARTGRLRDGFIGVRTAARAGGIVLGTWLMLLPLRLVSSYLVSAPLIDPDGPVARHWRIGLTVATVFVMLQIVAACSRGRQLR